MLTFKSAFKIECMLRLQSKNTNTKYSYLQFKAKACLSYTDILIVAMTKPIKVLLHEMSKLPVILDDSKVAQKASNCLLSEQFCHL